MRHLGMGSEEQLQRRAIVLTSGCQLPPRKVTACHELGEQVLRRAIGITVIANLAPEVGIRQPGLYPGTRAQVGALLGGPKVAFCVGPHCVGVFRRDLLEPGECVHHQPLAIVLGPTRNPGQSEVGVRSGNEVGVRSGKHPMQQVKKSRIAWAM